VATPIVGISVVVCTRTRPEMIADCVASVLRSEHPAFELVIVDNTDDASIVRQPPASERVRVVRQERRGLSRSRNTGIRNTRHDVLAFIDDDVIACPEWLPAVARAFEDDAVDAVTGLVVPAELETEAQREFEWYGGMGKGDVRRLFRGSALSAAESMRTQAVGVGANMIFRRRVFERVGTFDEALGAGTVTLGSEDLDFFHRVLRAGLTVSYDPAAVVSHRHRRTVAELRRQIFANGCAYGVYLMKIWSRRTVPRREVVAFGLSWAAGRLGTALFRLVARRGIRCRLAWDELRGLAHAPAAYRSAFSAASKG
jgi:glycosyltransferase involved in cell wall biosynthesis